MKQYLPSSDYLRSSLIAKMFKNKLTVSDAAIACSVCETTMNAFLNGSGKLRFSTLFKITDYLKLVPKGDKAIKNHEGSPVVGTVKISDALLSELEEIGDRRDVHLNIVLHEALTEYVEIRKNGSENL